MADSVNGIVYILAQEDHINDIVAVEQLAFAKDPEYLETYPLQPDGKVHPEVTEHMRKSYELDLDHRIRVYVAVDSESLSKVHGCAIFSAPNADDRRSDYGGELEPPSGVNIEFAKKVSATHRRSREKCLGDRKYWRKLS